MTAGKSDISDMLKARSKYLAGLKSRLYCLHSAFDFCGELMTFHLLRLGKNSRSTVVSEDAYSASASP
jgi:hypothetical protein